MKKIISLLLVTVMILCLCACSASSKLVGEWECEDAGLTIEFEKDGTGTLYEDGGDSEDFDWELEDGRIYMDGDKTDLKFKDGKLTMKDGGQKYKFKKVD